MNRTTGVRNRAWIALTALAGLTGCLDDGPAVDRVASLTKLVASDQQSGSAGGRLPVPLIVTALTADGAGVVRVAVRWTLVAGAGGALSDSVTVTDGNGEARVELTLGPVAGSYSVRAAVDAPGVSAVTFTASATPAPVIQSVTPSSFGGGDTVLLAGTDLHLATGFDVSGFPARLVAVAGGGADARIEIPFCLATGPVLVRATIGEAGGPPREGSYRSVAQPIGLVPGAHVSISVGGLSGCSEIPAAPSGGAEYLVVPQLISQLGPATVAYRLRVGDLTTTIATSPVQRLAPSMSDRFHTYLRGLEHDPPAPIHAPAAVARATAAPGITVGHRREFFVCADLECSEINEFQNVRAEARYVGRHAAIYIDGDAPKPGISDAELAALGEQFDQTLYDVDTRAFGAESDVDDNGLVIILMTPVVNALTPKEQCTTAFVTGFFFSLDLNPVFANDPRSNQSEIFYSFVPDPSGEVTCAHSVARVANNVGVTFAHEFQHMISYHQHVLLRGGRSEVLWLNEAMSHLAEELAGRQFRVAGDSISFSRFVIGNLVNAYDYLLDPEAISAVATDGNATLAERGASWMLVRWLTDSFGTGLTRRLSETRLSGVENIEAATGVAFTTLLPEWILANFVSDLEGFTPTGRLSYASWRFRATYASLNEQAPETFELPFPLVPDQAGGAGPYTRASVLRSGSGRYVVVRQGAGGAPLMLDLTEPDGAAFAADSEVRLNVLRIR